MQLSSCCKSVSWEQGESKSDAEFQNEERWRQTPSHIRKTFRARIVVRYGEKMVTFAARCIIIRIGLNCQDWYLLFPILTRSEVSETSKAKPFMVMHSEDLSRAENLTHKWLVMNVKARWMLVAHVKLDNYLNCFTRFSIYQTPCSLIQIVYRDYQALSNVVVNMLLIDQVSVDTTMSCLSQSGYLPRDHPNLASSTPSLRVGQTLSLHHMPCLPNKAIFSDA